MGLFDKKYCDICGEKIGLLGNRKLEDGNLCKDCARKLSLWFNERRSSTVAEIREQLEWREKNRERAVQFHATRSFGEKTKLLLDETHQWFTVTQASSVADANPDVLDFSVITGCRMDTDERCTELKMETTDKDGKIVRKSYTPARYEYDYDFYLIISVNVPYYNEMKFQINHYPVHIPYRATGSLLSSSFGRLSHGEPLDDPYYCSYKDTCEEVCRLLENIRSGAGRNAAGGTGGNGSFPGKTAGNGGISGSSMASGAGNDAAVVNAMKYISWTCQICHFPNSGTISCQHCGAPISDEEALAKARNLAAMEALSANLSGGGSTANASGTSGGGMAANGSGEEMAGSSSASWICPSCGAENQGKFCENCGTKRP